jgi:hypothetical protein
VFCRTQTGTFSCDLITMIVGIVPPGLTQPTMPPGKCRRPNSVRLLPSVGWIVHSHWRTHFSMKSQQNHLSGQCREQDLVTWVKIRQLHVDLAIRVSGTGPPCWPAGCEVIPPRNFSPQFDAKDCGGCGAKSAEELQDITTAKSMVRRLTYR